MSTKEKTKQEGELSEQQLDKVAGGQELEKKAAVSDAEECRRVGIRSTLGIPIAVGGRTWGAMVASSTDAEPLPAALPMTRELEAVFSRRAAGLSADGAGMLLVAAADDSESLAVVTRAAARADRAASK